jgi:EAL domain-containing protein (putative c-di-GMP-specific phosphodiesterase class I)
VAFAGHPKQRSEALLRDADAAMYRAKELGRDRFELFDEAMRARALTRLETEAALRQALEEGQLALYFQPEVELVSGRLLGAEALLRWRDREDRVALPTEFVPVAEETGLIVPIGEWALREACRQMASWRSAGADGAPATISVNLSARQLRHPELPDLVAEALSESGIDPGCLRLEITESTLMSDADAAVPALKALKVLGVGLAVDDFGTGYSSLAYLKRFPVDTLKLDHSFIEGLGRNPEDAAIVRAVLSLAQTLDLTVVAEGVERADQVAELQALGCRVGQGNYFSPPLPAERFSELL